MSTSALVFTPINAIDGIVARCKAAANNHVLLPVPKRKETLRSMLRLLEENDAKLRAALYHDVGKHPTEAHMLEVNATHKSIVYLLDHVDGWTREQRVPLPLPFSLLMKGSFHYEPLGCVLVLGAWNYPLNLSLSPVAGAICAGNTVIMKPSEVSSATAQLLAELVPKYFAPEVLSVVNGAVPETTALLEDGRLDHIFYTGSGAVGSIVMATAAKHLTPVTLELGGKSPVIVDESCARDMDTVAARIAWGKYINAGQTCVAPDYVLVQESVKAQFLDALTKKVKQFMGGADSPAADASMGRIVNTQHFKRVKGLLEGCGDIVLGGQTDEASLKIGLTVVDNVKLDSPLMQSEIFGPVLPIVPYRTADEALRFVNERPKPLALYVFSKDKAFMQRVKSETSSGGLIFNEVVLHLGLDALPFGGVGASGMGSYHGKASFETFSHRKSVLNDGLAMDSLKATRYAPYKAETTAAPIRYGVEKSGLRKAVESVITFQNVKYALCVAAGAAGAFLYTARVTSSAA